VNAFEDIVKLYLEEEGYWVRQSVKVNRITKEDKRNLKKFSMPTPEIDIVAYKAKGNVLLLVEVKSYFDSYGVWYEALTDKSDRGYERFRLFTNEKYRKIITQRLFNEYFAEGLINSKTTVKYGLAAGKIHTYKSGSDEKRIRSYFDSKGWLLFSPKQIQEKVTKLADKSWEDNIATLTAKIILRHL
jgi:hypothetical protein